MTLPRNSYFPEEAKAMEVDYDVPSQKAYDEPQRTVSSRIGALEEQLEKVADAAEMLRSEVERIKGVIG